MGGCGAGPSESVPCGAVSHGGSPRAYERVPIDGTAQDAVAELRAELARRGITDYAVVDHGHDMAAAGAPGFLAWTLVFGNPAAGAKLLARQLDAAVDIPLRLAVVQDDDGARIVLRDVRTLLDDGLTELADAFTGLLRDLAATVQRARAGA